MNRISGLYADADDPIANRPRSILPLHDFMPERPLPQLPNRPVNGCDDDYTDPVDSPKFGGKSDGVCFFVTVFVFLFVCLSVVRFKCEIMSGQRILSEKM